MKKIISMFLSLSLLAGTCLNAFAVGGNKDNDMGRDGQEILEDGTRLIYVSSDRVEGMRQYYEDRIRENGQRQIGTGKNLAIKIAAAAGGTLLGYIESGIDNPYLRNGLLMSTLAATLIAFFYPNYVNYDVDQVENHRMKMRPNRTTKTYDDRYRYCQRDGLRGASGCLNQCIDSLDPSEDMGIVIVERPDNFRNGTGFPSCVVKQLKGDPDYPKIVIETELRDKK